MKTRIYQAPALMEQELLNLTDFLSLHLSWNIRWAEGGNDITLVRVPTSIVSLFQVLKNKKLFHQNFDGTARLVVSHFRPADVPGHGWAECIEKVSQREKLHHRKKAVPEGGTGRPQEEVMRKGFT